MKDFDVVVIGAGPAGATAAYVAAQAGFRTAIIEKQDLHRPKVCGGLVTTPCAEIVRKTFGQDIATEALVTPGVLSVYLIPPTGLRDGFSQSHKKIYNVSREKFDGWLTDQAVGAGVEPHAKTQLLNLKAEGHRVFIHVKGPKGSESLTSPFVIGADGVYSSVRRSIRPDYPNFLMNVVQDYFVDEGRFEPYFYILLKRSISPSYAYVVPKDGCTMLGTGRIPGLPPDIDQGMAALRDWLKHDFGFKATSFVHREGWSVPFGSVCYGGGNVMLIGDAGGFCHPFTAEGILYGVQAGSMVANFLERAEGQAESLSQVYEAAFRGIGELMTKFKAFVLSLTDAELMLLAREKRAALEQAFGWDATKSIAYNLPRRADSEIPYAGS